MHRIFKGMSRVLRGRLGIRLQPGFRTGALVTALGALAAVPAHAQDTSVTIPDTVKEPAGINLGSTSFFDGLGTTKSGFIYMNYERYQDLDAITDNHGDKESAFKNPQISVLTSINQLIWISPIKIGGGAVGFNTLLPLVHLHTHFDQPGATLSDNGLGFGDFTFGTFYQSAPVMSHGRPVFQWRAEFDVIAPTGKFDRDRDINQSSGYWSLNPYLAFTALPTRKWEISSRIHYLYNFKTSRIGDAPVVSGLNILNGQAGQAVFANFDTSYEVAKGISPGINGFFFQQLTDDKTNGVSVANTKQRQLYVGPGVHFTLSHQNMLNLNAYFPLAVRNTTRGPQFNLYFIHVF